MTPGPSALTKRRRTCAAPVATTIRECRIRRGTRSWRRPTESPGPGAWLPPELAPDPRSLRESEALRRYLLVTQRSWRRRGISCDCPPPGILPRVCALPCLDPPLGDPDPPALLTPIELAHRRRRRFPTGCAPMRVFAGLCSGRRLFAPDRGVHTGFIQISCHFLATHR